MTEFLWQADQKRKESTQMWKFMESLGFKSYSDLHSYSILKKEDFWKKILLDNNVVYEGELDPVLLEDNFKSYSWFANTKLNFAENLLKHGNDESVALNFIHESGLQRKTNYKDLRIEVSSLQNYLKDTLKEGDVLAAFMPNLPETIVSMLAASSLGAIFTSTSCDFGIEGVLDRFGQTRPKVLVAAVGYEYGQKYFDLADKILALKEKIPSLEKIILVDFLGRGYDKNKFDGTIDYFIDYKEIQKNYHRESCEFKRLSFSHPLYIMYSSGTTGKPKCIVHSQGGTLLQHIKELGLHCDLTASKSIFFFTTCGWMMWNWLVSSLYFGSTVTLYEGSPAHPSPEYFFNIIKRENLHIFGTSPKFLKALEDTNVKFSDYPTLETILSTGSPLLPEQYSFVYNKIKKDVLLGSISGGTDIISCFMLACPILPVYAGEIQCMGLGMDIKAMDERQASLIEKEGELVCAQTFPSRPLYFLDDPKNEKINAAYFDQIPGVWAHGDFVKITNRGGVIVYGRSDATLNPGGVRIGTAEIYRQTESLNYLTDSLCVGRPNNGDVDVLLFVKLKVGEILTNDRKKQIKELIKKSTTPRHVPREIIEVKDIPYTRSGKKVELAVARIISGRAVTNIEALINPESLEEYKQYKIPSL